MIERCDLCHNEHETGGDYSFGGIPWKVCPEVPEDMLVPLRKVPVKLYFADGGECETGLFRYELAGPRVVNLDK